MSPYTTSGEVERFKMKGDTTWPQLLGFLVFYQAKGKLYRNSALTVTGIVLDGLFSEVRRALQVLLGMNILATMQASGPRSGNATIL
jgi:hypothetical protein